MDVASITNPIGKWVDLMLKPIMEQMPTFFKDSFAFLELIEDIVIVIPPGCSTFTSDAVNMYDGNIKIDAALSVICSHLRQTIMHQHHKFSDVLQGHIILNNVPYHLVMSLIIFLKVFLVGINSNVP